MAVRFPLLSITPSNDIQVPRGLDLPCLLQEIAEGKLTVGDLVLFLALMAQLYG